jgi:Protein of unknown function (DUF3551)
MRMRVLALAILTISAVSVTSSARAQTYDPNYPVCLKLIQTFGGEWNDCRFTSLEQCAPSALGLAAQCIINPYYAGATGPQRRDRRYRGAY